MSHQDDDHLRKNIATFKAILDIAVPESVSSFVRQENAILDPAGQRARWIRTLHRLC